MKELYLHLHVQFYIRQGINDFLHANEEICPIIQNGYRKFPDSRNEGNSRCPRSYLQLVLDTLIAITALSGYYHYT